MPSYVYRADKAARALWAPNPVPWEGQVVYREPEWPWRKSALVAAVGPDGVVVRLIVPWRRLRRVK
jgi:hypothetical protein